MPKVFQCPCCQTSLNYYAAGEVVVRCPACTKAVAVPKELRRPPAAFTLSPFSTSPFFARPTTPEDARGHSPARKSGGLE